METALRKVKSSALSEEESRDRGRSSHRCPQKGGKKKVPEEKIRFRSLFRCVAQETRDQRNSVLSLPVNMCEGQKENFFHFQRGYRTGGGRATKEKGLLELTDQRLPVTERCACITPRCGTG